MKASTTAQDFFDSYAAELLRRDAQAIADRYAVPALIEFPGQPIAVSDSSQTVQFFAGAFGQYEGITTARPEVEVVAHTEHSIWAAVTWHYDGPPGERNMYQLVRVDQDWKIAVLTPLNL